VVWDKTWHAIDERNIKMKKEQLSSTEKKHYAQLMTDYKSNTKEVKKLCQ